MIERPAQWLGVLALVIASGSGLSAQTVRVGVSGAAASNAEVTDLRQARGLGFAGTIRLDLPRLRVEGRVLHAALHADFSVQPDYDVTELDLTGSWLWRPFLAFQIGGGRRFMSPDFVAQDVGFVRIGVLSEARLARVAGIWVRGAYLPFTRFSGGGSAAPGFEVGLGASIEPTDSRLEGFIEGTYQRIDRHAAADAPIQYAAGVAGVRVRL